MGSIWLKFSQSLRKGKPHCVTGWEDVLNLLSMVSSRLQPKVMGIGISHQQLSCLCLLLSYRFNKEHKVKGFADDLTIISSSLGDHQKALTYIDESCKDVFLRIKLDKYVSMCLMTNMPRTR